MIHNKYESMYYSFSTKQKKEVNDLINYFWLYNKITDLTRYLTSAFSN